ncbi:MAG: pyridoxal-phosphate dependent enzyme, partial [Myxococcota bacterium]
MTPLEALPRRGFVAAPTPVEEARGLDLDWLGIKRDDRIEALAGGSKVRKLDVLLASSPWRDAPRWAGAGAIGSGQLVALSMAARATGRPLDAHVFWTPPDPWVLDNLAATASNAATVRYYPDRVALAVKAPAAVGLPIGSVPFVAPGASDPFGNAGMALAGLELAEQIAARQLPTPRRIYVPLGSGGTAVGLSYGLGRAGIRCEIHAVAVVEWVLSLRARLDAMVRALAARHGSVSPAPIVIRRTQLGRGYGFATDAGRDAVARLAGHGLRAEGNYGGKAFAQLVADAHAGWRGATLFWHTARGPLPPPAPDWADRLPAALRRR